MSMFDGNGYFFDSYVINSTVSNTQLSQSIITFSSLNMLDIHGNYQNIINLKNPINPQDAATKFYVDSLGTILSVTLSNTAPSLIASNVKGSFIITVSNEVLNGPSAIFHVTKSSKNHTAGVARTVSSPGLSSNTQLSIKWAINEGIYLYKSNNTYDGSYTVKFI